MQRKYEVGKSLVWDSFLSSLDLISADHDFLNSVRTTEMIPMVTEGHLM